MPVCRNGHTSETDDFCDECGVPMGAADPGVPPAVGSVAASGRPAPAAPAPVEVPDEACPLCGTPRSGRFCEEDGHDFVLAATSGPPTPAAGSRSPVAPPSVPAPSVPAPSAPASSGTGPPAAAPPASSPSGASVPAGQVPPVGSAGVPSGASVPSAPGWVLRVEADRRYYDTVVAREGPDIAAVSFPTYYPRAVVPLAGDEVRIGRRRASGATPPPEVDLSGPPLDPGVSHLHAVLLAGPAGWAVLDPGSTNGTTLNYRDEPIAVDTAVPVAAGDRIHVGAYTTLVLEQTEP